MALFLDSITDSTPLTLAKLLGRNASMISRMMMKVGLKRFSDYRKRYEWFEIPSQREELWELMPNRSPGFRAATGISLSYIVYYITNVLERIAAEPDKLLWHEDLVPPEIFHAMGLVPFLVEVLPILIPNVNNELAEKYIDVSENSGYPADICSLPKTVIGMVESNQLPPPKAVVASNSPCDGGMASYLMIEKKYNVPVFRLDLPYNFNDQRGLDYYIGEVKRMIAFLEEIYSVELDYDRLREVCEERNRCFAYTLDLWDLMRASPAPIGGETLVYSHLCYQLGGGTRAATKLMKEILRISRRIVERDGGGIPDERHRIILWNPPPLVYPELFLWMEKEYGAIVVMDMLTFRHQYFIDTKSMESMLRDLAVIMAHGPMAQHTRGPCENFFGDLFFMYESFNADMIMMAAHLGCKNTRALLGMFREMCRKRSIPLLIFDYDLSDRRPMPPEGIKKQVANFMENVMGEKK